MSLTRTEQELHELNKILSHISESLRSIAVSLKKEETE